MDNVKDEQETSKKVTTSDSEPLKLAVVGHTNTGKTSLLRTLLRDVHFGEVKNEASTTRHVERAMLNDSQTGEDLVALYDTPGLRMPRVDGLVRGQYRQSPRWYRTIATVFSFSCC